MSFADIVSPDGQTGYDLFWMSGSLEARVFARDGDTWEIVIRMTGTLSTPWPDKVTRDWSVLAYDCNYNCFRSQCQGESGMDLRGT